MTPLQVALLTVYEGLAQARETLSDEAFADYIFIVLERFRFEAERLALGEALRATKRDGK